jgi:hypothetical protein
MSFPKDPSPATIESGEELAKDLTFFMNNSLPEFHQPVKD